MARTHRVSLLAGVVLLALAGCQGGEAVVTSRPPVEVTSPAAGALVSDGAHDVALLIHHSGDVDLAEFAAQKRALESIRAVLYGREVEAESPDVRLAVVAAGAEAELVLPLTANIADWGGGLEEAFGRPRVGRASLEDGLRVALGELTGDRARREALPLVVHLARHGEPVSAELAAELVGAGVVVLSLGAGPDPLWPEGVPGALRADPAVPGGVGELLLLSHDPLTVRVKADGRWPLRVVVASADGDVLADMSGRGPVFAAEVDIPESDGLLELEVHVATGGADAAEARSSAVALPLLRPPAVVSVDPPMAVPGDTVVVRGRHFSPRAGGNVVRLKDLLVEPVAQTKSRLELVLPEGAPDGELVVLADDLPSAPAVLRVDADGDGLPNSDEVEAGTDPYLADTDGDGLPDGRDACPTQVEGNRSIDETGCSLCADGLVNGGETDRDCGGLCEPCEAGQSCSLGDDCISGVCLGGACAPDHCSSGERDGDEQGDDCGGSCAPCGEGGPCAVAADCESGACIASRCRPAHCVNGIVDGTETDVDCGGPCPPCALNEGCARNADCVTRICVDQVCRTPGCDDEVQNGDETDVDCGGPRCDPCGPGRACLANADCELGRCEDDGLCAGPRCDDGLTNGDETDVDCGGPCDPCTPGARCVRNADCVERVCQDGVCLQPTCSDGAANGEEADVDCGGPCARCPVGASCTRGVDCQEDTCQEGICVLPPCINGARDEGETDVDCGGVCAPCTPGRMCLEGTDCTSRICGEAGRCTTPTCDDGVVNGDEADLDCAGRCPYCEVGDACRSGADCASRVCREGRCQAPTCHDRADNADETDVDCGGPDCPACAAGRACSGPGDCLTGECFEGTCTIPACDDGRQNTDESAVDCGGQRCRACGTGLGCVAPSDCASGVCGGAGTCAPPTCEDGVRNGGETGDDCGGPGCAPCGQGGGCASGRDCASGVCRVAQRVGACVAAGCDDHVHNGDELAVDCGGGCGPCGTGMPCLAGAGCDSGVCEGAGGDEPGACAPPTCEDGVDNGGETAADCGGPCDPCVAGQACETPADCASGVCWELVCQEPACDDELANGGETGVDCGGPTACPRCPDAGRCLAGTDCTSRVCDVATLTCSVATCSDGTHNGDETDEDCGSSCPALCADGLACVAPSDCSSGVCAEDSTCAAPTCNDGVRNGDETDDDCGGGCDPCPVGGACVGPLDCESDICDGQVCAENTCNDGQRDGLESDKDCGGLCAPCGWDARCGGPADCQSGLCRFGRCAFPQTCAELATADPLARSDVYTLLPEGADEPVQVYCDQETDGGGWTLVSSSAHTPPEDAAAGWSEVLLDPRPEQAYRGIWDGLRATVRERPLAMRFACRGDAHAEGLDVDLSFYDVGWYQTITAGTDAQSCFAVPGDDPPWLPARRDNLSGEVLGFGTPWARGGLAGEGTCADPDSFTVDFADGGLDGDELDGTDWGEDDGLAKCGDRYTDHGAWFVWVRETVSHCRDCRLSGDETDVDCGGSCVACPRPCAAPADCESGVCDRGVCATPRCDDEVANGEETDVDCGGPDCVPCADGHACDQPEDCDSERCVAGLCRTLDCENGALDEAETDLDCGGPCAPCALGLICDGDADCDSGACAGAVCVPEPCANGEPDAGETDVDCGGPRCRVCLGGQSCAAAADCESGRCEADACGPLAACDDLWATDEPKDSGVYHLGSGPYLPVFCDLETDGGGWTLVAASAGAALQDEAGGYHDDLARRAPEAGHPAVWAGLREELAARADVRFACALASEDGGTEAAVDLSFYGVPWYEEMTSGAEAETCVNEAEGAGFERPAPQRRDNRRGRTRARGQGWRYELDGYLESEDACAAPDDFAVDFDDRGLDGDEADGTDWGLDDGVPKCGAPLSELELERTSFWIWVRRGLPGCFDGAQSGDETDTDCGGSCSAACALGEACASAADCVSRVCAPDTRVCSAPACDDGVENGNEEGVDCGGSCDPC